MKALSVIFMLALALSFSVSAHAVNHNFRDFKNFRNNFPEKYICIYEKHSKWHLEIDFTEGIIVSHELYTEPQVLEYQTYSQVEDQPVYEFKSKDFSESNRDSYLAYFNVNQRKVTIIRANISPGEEIKSYDFNCSPDDRHLLLTQ